MIVYGTPDFLSSVHQLADKHKKHYGACRLDICAEFVGRSIEELRQVQRPITDSAYYVAKKVRVSSSIGNSSKDGGYRVIVLVSKIKEEIIFLFVFPKVGPKGQDNYTHDYFRSLIKETLLLKGKDGLIKLDIGNSLAEL